MPQVVCAQTWCIENIKRNYLQSVYKYDSCLDSSHSQDTSLCVCKYSLIRGISAPKHSDKRFSACPKDILLNFVGKVGIEFGYAFGHLFIQCLGF